MSLSTITKIDRCTKIIYGEFMSSDKTKHTYVKCPVFPNLRFLSGFS